MNEHLERIADLSGQLAEAEANVAEAKAEVERHTPKAEKPTLFSQASDDKWSRELGNIFEKNQDRAERAPEFLERDGENLDARMERAYDWNQMSKAKQKEESDAAAGVQELKELAAKHNLTVEQAEAIKLGEAVRQGQQQAHEFSQGAEHMRSVFRDTAPSDTARWFADVKRSMDADPVGTVGWMAEQYGLHPMQLAQQIAQRYGTQPGQPMSQAAAQAAEREINRVADALPEFSKYEQDVYEVVSDPNFRRTGDYGADLRSAYNEAKRRDKALTFDQKIDKQLSRTYDRAQSRGKRANG